MIPVHSHQQHNSSNQLVHSCNNGQRTRHDKLLEQVKSTEYS